MYSVSLYSNNNNNDNKSLIMPCKILQHTFFMSDIYFTLCNRIYSNVASFGCWCEPNCVHYYCRNKKAEVFGQPRALDALCIRSYLKIVQISLKRIFRIESSLAL